MTRTGLAIITLVALIIALTMGLTIKSDGNAIFDRAAASGERGPATLSRDVIVGVDAPDPEQRAAAAKLIAKALLDDPLITQVSAGPVPPSQDFLDWVWEKRFHLAPPTTRDFDSATMATRLKEARELFSSAEGLAFGDLVLLDPTGSYVRALNHLRSNTAQPDQQGGIWTSTDGETALLFAKFTDKPFDASTVYALTRSIRQTAAAHGVTVSFLGARTIAAETTLHSFRASARASILAGILLIAWLIFSLRSITAVLRIMLPLGLGVASAILITQLIFGYVHVIALGFGGALVGLALDYPIHLLGHTRASRPRAARLVLLGALTTSLAFLAMLGSDIAALVQTGVFVGSGLMISALASVSLPQPDTPLLTGFSFRNLGWKLPFRSTVLAGLAAGGLVVVLTLQSEKTFTLFAPPAAVLAEMEQLRTKLKLPSAQYSIVVRGRDLDDLLSNENALVQTLDSAVENGTLLEYSMVANLLAAQDSQFLPAETYKSRAQLALETAGMAVSFADQQTQEYTLGLASSDISYEDLLKFPETRLVASNLEKTNSGLQEQVHLYLPPNTGAPAFDITSPSASLVDSIAPVRQALHDIQTQVITWLSIGAGAGVFLLGFGLRSWRKAGHIFLVSAATVGVTATLLILFFGSISIFQILALALVVGIGVDYSLFIKEMKEDTGQTALSPSVILCATSTLIAFGVLSFSGVQILQQVGMTVVVGLLVMLLLTLAEPQENT